MLAASERVRATAPRFVGGLLNHTRQHRLEVKAPGGEVVLWAVNLSRPWLTADGIHQMRPPGHAATLDELLDAFVAEGDVPVVVAGDTNLTDRGCGVPAHDGALRRRPAARGRADGAEWFQRPLRLRVDHVFVPKRWCAERARRFPRSGSDHRGVAVRIGRCATSR